MTDEGGPEPTPQGLGPEEFEALRDATAASLGVDPRLVEKDYWATQVLRVATRPTEGHTAVFKGGTSLSKAFGLIERFSEDIDLLIVTDDVNNPLKRRLRAVADSVTDELGLDHERENQGRGYLNARYAYEGAGVLSYLTTGVLLEMGSRGGPDPNTVRTVTSLMGDQAERIESGSPTELPDLRPFDVTVLAPERTLAEKLAFLHHRATVGDTDNLRQGARHLYDVAMLLNHDDVINVLSAR